MATRQFSVKVLSHTADENLAFADYLRSLGFEVATTTGLRRSDDKNIGSKFSFEFFSWILVDVEYDGRTIRPPKAVREIARGEAP